MGNFFDNLYDVLFQPRTAMRQIADAKSVGQAAAVVILSGIIPIWAVYFGLKTAGMNHMFGMLVFMQLVGGLLMWIVGAAIWHLIAEMLGGKGSALGLLSALGFAQLPRIFIVPLWVIAAVLPAGMTSVFMGLTGLGIAAWMLYLDVTALKESHQLSGARAVLVFLAPPLAIAAAVLAIVVYVGSAVMRMPGFL